MASGLRERRPRNGQRHPGPHLAPPPLDHDALFLCINTLTPQGTFTIIMMLLLLLILCLLLAALIMLLLITLSVPIIKPIYLFRLVARDSIAVVGGNATVTATFGVWGYCISPLQASWVISLFLNDLVISALRIVSVLGVSTQTSEECSRMKLGYTFDSTVVNALCVWLIVISSLTG